MQTVESTPNRPRPGRTLSELQAQHDALRGMMDRCVHLAAELDARRASAAQLADEVARLRRAFEAHNAFEEHVLRPALLERDTHAGVRIDRMVEDHVAEHRTIGAQLEISETARLRDVVETLRAHLDAEERYLFTAKALRDELGARGLR